MSFDLLHALALRRKADTAALQASTGLSAAEIETGLAPAVAEGLAICARGLYLVAPKGAAWLQEQYPQAFAAQRGDGDLTAAYERFEIINRDLKALITQWQTLVVGGKPVPNDHRDSAYDGRILDRLGSLHDKAAQVIAAMAARLPRLGRYVERLASALERAESGETEWVSGIRCDSYHTVWFEMHEDLLRLLGRRREE